MADAYQAVSAVSALLTSTVSNDVGEPSWRYKQKAPLRALPRTLMGGTEAMREAGKNYLPQQTEETDDDYAARVNATFLYNGFADTVVRQSSKFFEDPILLQDDVPPPLVTLCEDIDGQGRAINPFATDLAKEAFVDGVSFILVDAPKLPAGSTLADAKQLGSRPYWCLIRADDLLGWRTESVGGVQRLVQVRVRECTTEPDGEFGEKEVKRIRVLEPGSYRLYEYSKLANNKYGWVLKDSGLTTQREIMLVPFYTNRTGYLEGEPPLKALAELNQEHWVSSSENRHALTFARFAMLHISGITDTATKIVVGPNKTILTPPGGSAEYIEPTGAGINSGYKDLEMIENRMRTAGMILRVERAGKVTATAVILDSGEANAALKAVAKGLQDAIEQALLFTAQIMKLSDGGSVKVYDDFGGGEIPGTVTEMTSMRSLRDLSQETYWSEMQRRGVLSEDFDPAVEQARLQGDLQQEMLGSGLPPTPTGA